MERKIPFEKGEIYHLYTRGVDKQIVFRSDSDYERLMRLLLFSNRKGSLRLPRMLKNGQGEPLPERLVDIVAYALMPNHIHLIVRERITGGISKFMLKLMTAYSMFFNIKYERSGPMFTRPFRSKHVDTDEYFRWVFSYIHLNPLEIMQCDWKERGIESIEGARKFLQTYRYSSFPDYADVTRPESRIITKDALPVGYREVKTMDDLLEIFFVTPPNAQKTSPYQVGMEKALV